ncbi:MAG: hypothetical protein WCA49_22090 [Candidatus Sulfotelmatobacter sp.]
MLFKYSYEISGLRSHLPETEDLEFRFDKPRLVIVRLTRGHPDSKNSSEPLGAMCLAETAQEPADGKIASDLDSGLAGPSEGKWPLLKEATPSTIEFIDGIFRVLKDLIERTVAVFRWREGLPEGPHNPYRNPRGYYSKDGEVWCEVSLARSATIRWGIPPSPRTPPSEMCDEVVKLVSAGIEEPLGHQLFREAWNERATNPRSSLVIGVAAAEVGLKKLIGSLVPEAKWLVDEIQAPPFSNMVRKYLPTLPVRALFQGKPICPPSKVVKTLDRAFTYRNHLVHAGKAAPHLSELEEILKAVNDFLWICDVYEGYVWASTHISLETRIAWKEREEAG